MLDTIVINLLISHGGILELLILVLCKTDSKNCHSNPMTIQAQSLNYSEYYS